VIQGKRPLLKVLFVTTLGVQLIYAQRVEAQTISEETKLLARCEGVYFYAAHLAQMSNNEGLAKNLLFRSSTVTAAHLFLNEKKGRVSGDVIRQITQTRLSDKRTLDANSDQILQRIDQCDKTAQPIIEKVRGLGKIWDNRTYDEWQHEMFQQNLRNLGIR
jgi:hypothetical protein